MNIPTAYGKSLLAPSSKVKLVLVWLLGVSDVVMVWVRERQLQHQSLPAWTTSVKSLPP